MLITAKKPWGRCFEILKPSYEETLIILHDLGENSAGIAIDRRLVAQRAVFATANSAGLAYKKNTKVVGPKPLKESTGNRPQTVIVDSLKKGTWAS